MENRKPWLKKYDPGVPEAIIYPDLCIQEFLSKQASTNPQRIAIIDEERSIDYASLFRQASNFARNLIRHQLKTGERVGICLPNSIEFAVAFYGTLMAGGVVSALNPRYSNHELEFQIKKADVRFAIIEDVRQVDFIEFKKSGILEQIILVPTTNEKTQAILQNEGELSFDAITLDTDAGIGLPELSSEMPAVYQFSGGTTGTPKVAIGSHKNIVSNVMQFRRWLVNLEEGNETFLVAIPLYHVYGMVLGLNLGVAMGARMIFIRDARDIEKMLNQMQEYQVSYFPGVPSTFNMINEYPGVKEGKYDLRMIKACISGSAPLSESTRLQFEKYTGGHLVEGYGLSEAPTATHCNPILGEKRAGSIGLPLPDVECRIIQISGNHSDEAADGESGELLIRAPQIISGYYKDPAESEIALKGGWLHTGDIARMDNNGYFYLSGRIKDLIKVHGLQVWPQEIEEVLVKHPAVTECAVAGVPDPKSGERVKVWIVRAEGHYLDLADLQDFCKNFLAGYKIPSEVEFCESIPKSAVGKILRRELVREHMEKNK